MFSEEILLQVKNLPLKPGVYIMRDKDNTVIYVGKAKILKNRVSQYFQSLKNAQTKTIAMVHNIERFEYIVTDSELEALVLECNLIKKYMPKYNILLKDDKAYPFIKVTLNELYPRVLLVRKTTDDGAKYYGPYLNSHTIYETIDILKKIFMIRSCTRILPRDIGKSRECLNYSMKQCSGPCNGHITQQEYKQLFKDICDFLEGKHALITESLQLQMQQASNNLEFEKAARLRDNIATISQISKRQKIISIERGNQDIIALARNKNDACVQIFFVRGGRIVGRNSNIIKDTSNRDNADLLGDFVKQFYSMSTYIPSSIILHSGITDRKLIEEWLREKSDAKISIIVPKRGEKREVTLMVERNAIEELQSYQIKHDITHKKMDTLLFELKDALGLNTAPLRIEAYDISNISGASSVGAMVVFENGLPKKSNYRKFNIKSVDSPDDYESMREVIYRRLTNGVEGVKGFAPLPDLIFVDGGKGHVSAINPIIEFFNLNIPVFGIVKDDNHKTRGLTTHSQEVTINRTGKLFRFLTQIQDEVHRFAITAHHARHKNILLSSELNGIPGVGSVRHKSLLKHFGDIKKIKLASLEELEKVVSSKIAREVYKYFHDDSE